MPNRREFLRSMARASAGACFLGKDLIGGAGRNPQGSAATPKRGQVSIGGRRVQTVDMHCHFTVPAIAAAIERKKVESQIAGLQGGVAAAFDAPLEATPLLTSV